MNAILSIKAKYVREILKGTKKYEFRKMPFKKDVKEIYVYVPKPIGKIICKFHVGKIIEDSPRNLWENFGNFSGLTEEEFFTYFSGKTKGYAIEINGVKEFTEPIDPTEIHLEFIPPQSWICIPDQGLF